MASNITLQETINWSKRLNFNRQSVIGSSLEPAKTCANIVKQTLLSPPFRWRWNRDTVLFTCTPGTQDYTNAASWTSYAMAGAWQANHVYPIGASVIDTNGNTQRVSTPGTSAGTVPTWETTLDANTTDNTVVWVNLGTFGTTSSVPNFSWIESASIQDPDDDSWKTINVKISLANESAEDRPGTISAEADDGSGVITFRLLPVPDKAYVVNLTIQQKAELFASVYDTWFPIPDEYSYIYNWGFLALMWLFADDPRWQLANQKFMAGILGSNSGLDETERDIFLDSWNALFNGTPAITSPQIATQGVQARGI